jgi:hypothetical protein
LGVLSGFSDKINFIKPYLVPILYGLLLDIVIGLVIITIFTLYRNKMTNYFTLIENGYLLSILRHNIILGFISMASLDIGPITLYQYYLIQQFAMVLIGSRDELYSSLRITSRSKLVSKQDGIDFLFRALLLEVLTKQEYMRYKFFENQFKNLPWVSLLSVHSAFIHRYEGRIVVKKNTTKRSNNWSKFVEGKSH